MKIIKFEEIIAWKMMQFDIYKSAIKNIYFRNALKVKEILAIEILKTEQNNCIFVI